MKLSVVTFAAIGLMASGIHAWSEEPCVFFERNKITRALTKLWGNSDVVACSNDSGYDITTASAGPTDEQLRNMCELDACKRVIKFIVSKDLPDCVFTTPSGVAKNMKGEAADFGPTCDALK
ncbi:TPA: hypothetical protein N0F65_004989 [Lagenidium giganteum]|uniref:Elicitin n=1 Tax=Lagenidium giganteum TaxID=4803 RepID=A0AAV2ZI02_9STRA|nr:TPA: hypothetical protein N0F65_004989 [Lagenidium giganteum]